MFALFKNIFERTSLLFTVHNICGFYRCNIVVMYYKFSTFSQVFEGKWYTFDVDAVLQYRINEIVLHEMNDISEEIYSKSDIEIFAQRLPRCISN